MKPEPERGKSMFRNEHILLCMLHGNRKSNCLVLPLLIRKNVQNHLFSQTFFTQVAPLNRITILPIRAAGERFAQHFEYFGHHHVGIINKSSFSHFTHTDTTTNAVKTLPMFAYVFIQTHTHTE